MTKIEGGLVPPIRAYKWSFDLLSTYRKMHAKRVFPPLDCILGRFFPFSSHY
jgi:hypothetical protein